MKKSKSPDNAETTPNKKKLRQARLPFSILSDVSPKPDATQPRKRKLSASDAESIPKPKIYKENDLIEETLIISDDDSKDEVKCDKDVKLPNPFVKLVDTAWKKKLHKSKRKKKTPKKVNASCEVRATNDSKELAVESMDVDETPITEVVASQDEQTIELNEETTENNETVTLEDSNSPSEYAESNKNNELSKQNSEILDNKIEEDVEESQESIKDTACDSEDVKNKNTDIQVTPKRSLRNRTNCEQNNSSKVSPNSSLNDSKSSLNSKNNDSMCSTMTTPKNSKTVSVTNTQGDVSLNESTTSASLTPKQVQKKLESAKKKEERDKKRQQEKEERAKLKQEKEDQKKREREEKEEAKRKEKEEKEKQKELEKKQREEKEEQRKKEREEKEEQKKKEKEEKEEQRRKEKEAREEEKRKKQEALELEKQEQELKKKKAAEAFVNFFVPKQKSEKDQATICSVSNSMLSNFTIKSDMRLAPLVRVNLSDNQKQNLENLLLQQAENVLYLESLKDGVSKPLTSGKTWPLTDKDDDDVMIIEDAELPPIDGAGEILSSQSVPCEKFKTKLFSFHENRRPPYWGTWRKKSTSITPRKPFTQDQKLLDYEVDSDDEWEEEQEGESIDGSAAGSDDEQDGDEYEVDNVVFVPHGYLSDEEATMDEDDVLSLSPETQKARLKHLEDEFKSEMKKPTEKLKPRMYGLLWETSEGGKPDKCVDALWNYFRKMSMIMNDPTPLLQPSSEPEESEKKKVKKKKQAAQTEGEQKSPKSKKKEKNKQDEKDSKTPKSETKKKTADIKKNQPGINMFLTKVKSS